MRNYLIYHDNSNKRVDFRDTDNHKTPSAPLVQVVSMTSAASRDIIIMMHQYSCYSEDETARSFRKIKHLKNQVNDKSIQVGGKDYALTSDNYVTPASIKNGFLCTPLRPYSNKEQDSTFCTFLVSDVGQDPIYLDCLEEITDKLSHNAQDALSHRPSSDLIAGHGSSAK